MKCAKDSCPKPSHAKNLCSKHYAQWIRANNPELRAKAVAYTKAWKLKNKEKHAAQQARQHEKYKGSRNAYVSQWKRDNWDTYKAYLAARKKRVKQATPPWADLAAIEDFYRNCPKGFHVDHIEPLNGKDRSGLHVIWNLQYLPALENLKKGNKTA